MNYFENKNKKWNPHLFASHLDRKHGAHNNQDDDEDYLWKAAHGGFCAAPHRLGFSATRGESRGVIGALLVLVSLGRRCGSLALLRPATAAGGGPEHV